LSLRRAAGAPAHRFKPPEGLLQVAYALFRRSAQPLDQEREVNAMRARSFNAATGSWVEQFFFHLIHIVIVSPGSLLF
jgi:hypothetical protein